ncbi:hypothetical protein [Methylobacterium sp. NEAU K]|uniref:hypothetical protein n=1 Tax=Methylobacterium sp. NEAU K TaxID=3064946 RepID=UPI002735F87E|nr:hypothetical protein [Methylobacterium sp. NEAU K]MDP4005081.1 hypothetical protein [Methylobacterium sp. NEAU K]
MTLKQALAAPIGTVITHTGRNDRLFTDLCAAGYFQISGVADRQFTFQRMSGPLAPMPGCRTF